MWRANKAPSNLTDMSTGHGHAQQLRDEYVTASLKLSLSVTEYLRAKVTSVKHFSRDDRTSEL